MRRLLFIICVFFLSVTAVMAQKEKVKNQPYADLKWFHLGFHVGLHAQDLILTNTGVATNGETWYAEDSLEDKVKGLDLGADASGICT